MPGYAAGRSAGGLSSVPYGSIEPSARLATAIQVA